jgi:hypothetical protein
MGNLSSRKTPPELVVAVCVLGTTTAYLLAQAQRREDICAALFRFEQKYSVTFPPAVLSMIFRTSAGDVVAPRDRSRRPRGGEVIPLNLRPTELQHEQPYQRSVGRSTDALAKRPAEEILFQWISLPTADRRTL